MRMDEKMRERCPCYSRFCELDSFGYIGMPRVDLLLRCFELYYLPSSPRGLIFGSLYHPSTLGSFVPSGAVL